MASGEELDLTIDDVGRRAIESIIADGLLTPLFQPIIDLKSATVYGYEGLSRGPSDSAFHNPIALFGAAETLGLLYELEDRAVSCLAGAFDEKGGFGKLFLNVTPQTLAKGHRSGDFVLATLDRFGLDPSRVVIELTESQPIMDMSALAQAAEFFRSKGFAIALDDLGEGYSSLKLWDQLYPEFIKIDRHFIDGVSKDSVKYD